MKRVTVKTAAEAQDLIADKIEFVHENGNVVEVHVGGLVVKQANAYSNSLTVLREQPYEEVERHRVVYTVAGRTHEETFEDYSKAADAARVLREKLDYADVVQDTVKAWVDEAGNVTGLFAAETKTEVTS